MEHTEQVKQVQHTKLPWHLDPYEMYIFGPKQEMVADTIEDDGNPACRVRGYGADLPQEANGRFIVRACNTYYQRQEALEAALYWLEQEAENPGQAKPDAILQVLRDALA